MHEYDDSCNHVGIAGNAERSTCITTSSFFTLFLTGARRAGAGLTTGITEPAGGSTMDALARADVAVEDEREYRVDWTESETHACAEPAWA